MLGTDCVMNVMAYFVEESVAQGEILNERDPHRPARVGLQNLIDVELNPRRLALPFRVISALNSSLRDSPATRSRFPKPVSSWLACHVSEHDAVKPPKISFGYRCQ